MANPVTARGLQPVRYVSGGPYNGATDQYVHDSGDSTAIFKGDLVKITGASSTINGKTLPNVIKAASGDVFDGVVVSVEPDTRDSLIYCAASTTRVLNVCTDPNVLFEVMDANSGTALTTAALGLNCNLSISSGSTVTGYSDTVLDNTSEATTNTLDVKIIGFVNRADNAPDEAASKFLVRINRHRLVNQIAGV